MDDWTTMTSVLVTSPVPSRQPTVRARQLMLGSFKQVSYISEGLSINMAWGEGIMKTPLHHT